MVAPVDKEHVKEIFMGLMREKDSPEKHDNPKRIIFTQKRPSNALPEMKVDGHYREIGASPVLAFNLQGNTNIYFMPFNEYFFHAGYGVRFLDETWAKMIKEHSDYGTFRSRGFDTFDHFSYSGLELKAVDDKWYYFDLPTNHKIKTDFGPNNKRRQLLEKLIGSPRMTDKIMRQMKKAGLETIRQYLPNIESLMKDNNPGDSTFCAGLSKTYYEFPNSYLLIGTTDMM
jgi:hypothetical protein